MPKTSAATPNSANFQGGILCSENAASVRLTQAISELAKTIFDKPYRALVDILQISERDAHYRLSSRRKYTALEISRLLQSEEGIQFLVVLMDKARPKWWRAILHMGVLGTVQQRRQADLKLMRRVFDADQSAAAAFSDSFRAQDPDFFGAVLAGHDEAAALGLPDRPVAPTRKGR